MEILPRLHWIDGRASNIYLWQDESGLILVDTGMPGDIKKILEAMAANSLQPTDVVAILITHADIDHAGGAAELSARCQAPIMASSKTADLLTIGKSPEHMPRIIQFISDRFFGYKTVAKEAIKIIEDGQMLPELPEWQALATPGHCADHFSFYSPIHGILFAGDALGTRGDRLHASPRRITADPVVAAQSARRLLQLTPAVFACGHGRPMVDHSAEDVMMLFQEMGKLATQRTEASPAGAPGGK